MADVSRLRENELVGLAREFENAGRADEGIQLRRAWLDDQRKRKLGGRVMVKLNRRSVQ